MKNEPINDGKDVPKYTIEDINLLSGKYKSMQTDNDNPTVEPFEPKRNNRWCLNFSGNFEGVPMWTVKKTSRPRLINGSWSNIKITFYDSIGTSTANAIVNAFRTSWQVNDRVSKSPIITYKLHMLDPTGVAVEEWLIRGRVIDADFGKLNYANAKLSKIKLVIEPISVILNF